MLALKPSTIWLLHPLVASLLVSSFLMCDPNGTSSFLNKHYAYLSLCLIPHSLSDRIYLFPCPKHNPLKILTFFTGPSQMPLLSLGTAWKPCHVLPNNRVVCLLDIVLLLIYIFLSSKDDILITLIIIVYSILFDIWPLWGHLDSEISVIFRTLLIHVLALLICLLTLRIRSCDSSQFTVCCAHISVCLSRVAFLKQCNYCCTMLPFFKYNFN